MPVVAAFAVPHPPLIVPGVGRGREAGIPATVDAYREVARRIADLAPETIAVSSPHSTSYLDYLHISGGPGARGDFGRFGDAADGSAVAYDEAFVDALCEAADACDLPAGTAGERDPELDWGVLVPLHFIQEEYARRRDAGDDLPTYRLVRIGLSGLSPRDHYRLGQLVQHTADTLGRRCVYVASGDLSHKLTEDGPYGYAPDGPAFDELVCHAFEEGDFLSLLAADPGMCERAAECGLRSFQIMAGALDRTPVRPELLSYEGPFGVGYGIAAFEPTGPAGSDGTRAFGEAYARRHAEDLRRRREAESPWVRLARFSLESFVRGGRRVDPDRDLPGDLAAALPGSCSPRGRAPSSRSRETGACAGASAPSCPCAGRWPRRSARTPSRPAAGTRASTPWGKTSSTSWSTTSTCSRSRRMSRAPGSSTPRATGSS